MREEMMWLSLGLLVTAALLAPGSCSDEAGATSEKLIPLSVSFNPALQQQQPYQTVYQPQPQYQQPQVPYNEAVGPPDYGNSPGPGPNAIAPNVNPYPRLSHCITTGYPCNSSRECCTAACDVFGPAQQCCIPEGQVCDFARPTAPNNYACCYPLHCDPYKRGTGITVCQERKSRYPDQRTGEGPEDGGKLSYPWYSEENPLYRGSEDGEKSQDQED